MNNDGFTKLFSSIVTSSIWSEDDKTRIMWITILALTDQDGYCQASIPGLAAVARMTVEDAEKAIKQLEAPDKYSRSLEHEGRRIARCDGGWIVLNHSKYRDKARQEKRREYMKNLMREKRQTANSVLTDDNHSASVSVSVSESESLKEPEWKPTPVMLQIGSWFKRKPTTRWNQKELKALKALGDPPPEIEVMARYYTATIPQDQNYRRRDLQTLLNNWNGELDRARVFMSEQSKTTPAQIQPRNFTEIKMQIEAIRAELDLLQGKQDPDSKARMAVLRTRRQELSRRMTGEE